MLFKINAVYLPNIRGDEVAFKKMLRVVKMLEGFEFV